jgi:hypothetical protein
MTRLFKISTMLFVSALSAFILSCEVIGIEKEKNEKIETALLLDFINYSGKITFYVDENQESYGNYAFGFYSNLFSETWIAANSDTIANRYIQIILHDNIKIEGNYTTPANNISIELCDGFTTIWSSNWTGGSATITITKYGAVGETIEGEFSCTLKSKCGNNTLNIINGKFAVRRTADQ